MGKWKKWLVLVLGLVTLLSFGFWWILFGQGEPVVDREVTQARISEEEVVERLARQQSAAGEATTRILFGDVHVHTSLSVDAFQWSLPMLGGDGVHPPADACDFARFCSQLDFFALTDHAEALTPRTWAMSKEMIQNCNAVPNEASDADLVAFLGFEWTQIGLTPEEHYGHKNIFFKNTGENQLPTRPIAAPGLAVKAFSDIRSMIHGLPFPFIAFPNQKPYNDAGKHLSEIRALDNCPDDVDTRELPPDCRELAATPQVLFRKLDEWGYDSFVIPHGTTWGLYTPPGYTWDKGIEAKNDDPARQRAVEVFSGHGNSEEYRAWRAIEDDGGQSVCPEPTEDYEPCCWRAGEIVRSRCEEPGSSDCEERAAKARSDYLIAGVAGHLTIPGAELDDWGDCGQCRDCFEPAFAYRPGGSTQYMLAKGDFENVDEPRHMTLGFIASSDNHTARPGTGYKEFGRFRMTETRGPTSAQWEKAIFGERGDKIAESKTFTPKELESTPGFRRLWFERQASYFLTGGLVAAHATDRSRESIWSAIQTRNVYGTSGPRILLWFDMLNAPQGAAPMGSELAFAGAPSFRVRAAGSFEQLSGCSEEIKAALGEDRLEQICAGECYRPSDKRLRITRIEVVRIVRQNRPDEDLEALIEDPWLTIPCDDEGDICEVEFEDPEYALRGRDALYYVRAIQEPTEVVNGEGTHCNEGKCETCLADYNGDPSDDCLSTDEERAWSSPIYLTAQ
ncbi:MAG: DUF3604 domain-containing protein [Polyangiales bacterium]